MPIMMGLPFPLPFSAAMILSHRPDLLASDVKKILMDSVKPLNSLNGKVESGGMVRADKALQLANTYRTSLHEPQMRKLTENGEIKPSKLVSWNVEGENKDIVMGLTGAGHYFEGDSITIENSRIRFSFHGLVATRCGLDE